MPELENWAGIQKFACNSANQYNTFVARMNESSPFSASSGGRFVIVFGVGMAFSTAVTVNALAQYNYTTLTVPGAEDTYAVGVSGNNVVGYYYNGSFYQGFLYNGSGYTTLDDPEAVDNSTFGGTYVSGISGNNIVGYYYNGTTDVGFLYNGSGFTTLNVPFSQSCDTAGVSGNDIVGNYINVATYSVGSYLYDGNSYTPLNVPGQVSGINGNNVVGNFVANDGYNQGFIYNGSSYTTLNVPGAGNTMAFGISGNNVVGYYDTGSGTTDRGFLFDGSGYTTLNVPGAEDTYAYGIDGNSVVGQYYNGNSDESFLATPVPEPSILAFGSFAVGLLAIFRLAAASNFEVSIRKN